MSESRRQVAFSVVFSCGLLTFSSCGPSARQEGPEVLDSIQEVKSSLHEHTARVRFQGTITAENANFGYFIVQDQTGGIRVQPTQFQSQTLFGHRVEIEGSLPTISGADAISDASLKDLGPAALPEPQLISADSYGRANVLDNKFVRLQGTARTGHVDAAGQFVFPVRLGSLEVSIRVVDDRGLNAAQLMDSVVQVRGVASTGVGVYGNLTDLALVVANAKLIQIVHPAPDTASLPVTSVKKIQQAEVGSPLFQHRIRLRGALGVKDDGESYFFHDPSGSIPVLDLSGYDGEFGQAVDMVAFLQHSATGWSLVDLGPAQKELGPATAAHPTITSIGELHKLTPAEARLGIPVALDCTLTYYDPTWLMSFISDRTGGVYASLHGNDHLPDLHAGDRVLVQGISGAGDFAPIVQNPRFVFVEHTGFPPPVSLPVELVFSGQADSQWVELEGVVQGVTFSNNHASATISYGSHRFGVIFPPPVTLKQDWVNKYVKLRGAAGTRFNNQRQVLGIDVYLQTLDQMRGIANAGNRSAENPEQVTAIGNLLQFQPNTLPGHSVHLKGNVLVSNPQGPTWIKDHTGAVMIQEHNQISLTNGDLVEVVGFPVAGAFAAEIHDAMILRRSAGAPVQAVDVTPERVLFEGVDGQLVRLEGRLVGEFQNGEDQTLMLRGGKTSFRVRGSGNLPAYDLGTLLRVTGICSISAKRFGGVLVPNSFEIVAHSASSIEVLEHAPWLTQQRAWRALAVTVILITLALIWALTLRRRVARQTRLIHEKLLEVEKLRANAEAASAAKSQFLANMSHEIRTPMNGILGMTELAMQAESAEEQRECLTTIRSSGNALLSILNDLLDLSKIEAGKFEIHPAPFSLRELLSEAGKVFSFRMREKGITFESFVQDGLPDLLLGDALRLRQILLNLLGNAVKFTHEGVVAFSAAGDIQNEEVSLRIAVRDSGIGISPERQTGVFEAFRQADNSITRKYGGTGLGLSICMKLAALMQGTIELESAEGKGSTFTLVLTLPVAKSRRQAREARVAFESFEGHSLNILLAEDNLVNQKVAAKLLEKQGHHVSIAENGLLAVQAFERGRFDLILMDVQMPEMDGLEATRTIREREEGTASRVPIIAMTAQTMTGDRENCFAAGMDDFVSKPIHLPELWAALKRAQLKTSQTDDLRNSSLAIDSK